MHIRSDRSIPPLVRALMALVFVLISYAFLLESALAQALCFPQVTGLPVKTGSSYTFPNNPPLIPGTSCGTGSTPACPSQPEDDTGWFNGFRYTIETGTDLPNQPSDGAFQAIAQSNQLYFSFELNNESLTPSGTTQPYDYLILAFVNYPPSGSSANPVYTWIVISGPFAGTPAATPQAVPANNISLWQGTSADPTTWSGPVTGPIGWIQAGMFAAVDPQTSTYKWWVVVSIDNAAAHGPGPQLPASGQFGIFMDAIRGDVSTFVDSQATFNLPLLPVTTNPDAGNPPPSQWASATLTPSGCSGVFITSSDITNTIGGVPTDNISYTNLNNFKVKVHNSGVDAPQVQATFKIAEFGLPAPNNWQVLGFDVCGTSPAPAGCPASHSGDSVNDNPNPTGNDVPAAVSTPTGSCNDGTGNGCSTLPTPVDAWTPGASNAAFYKYDDNQHQCVRVDLTSLVGTTTFINNSAWNNFQFSASASNFTGPARVSAEYPAVGTNGQQTFHLNVAKKAMDSDVAEKTLSDAGRNVRDQVRGSNSNYLSFIVGGCRLSGKTLKIPARNADGRPTKETVTLQNCDSVGSYGYLIGHDGPVDTWNTGLTATGSGVSLTASTTSANSYTLVIPQGQAAEVVTNVIPSTGGKGGAWKFWWAILLFIVLLAVLFYRPGKHV